MDADGLAALKGRLAGIVSDHSARMELAAKKFEESTKEAAQKDTAFSERKQRLADRLAEMGRKARGEGKPQNKELSFGLEDETAEQHDDLADEIAAYEKYRAEQAMKAQNEGFLRREQPEQQPEPRFTAPAPVQAPAPPVAPLPPVRQPPAVRRPARPAQDDDDDDYSGQTWLR